MLSSAGEEDRVAHGREKRLRSPRPLSMDGDTEPEDDHPPTMGKRAREGK